MRDLIDKPFNKSVEPEDIISAYRLILGRNPEKGGYEHYEKLMKKGFTLKELFLDFINSKEYRDKIYPITIEHSKEASSVENILSKDEMKNNILLINHLPVEIYNNLYQKLLDSQPLDSREYFKYHRERYYELFNAMVYYLRGKSKPRVLEIGVSGFLPLYKKLFPNIILYTIDRPTYQHGFDAKYCVEICGAEHHYSADLNRINLSKSWGNPSLGVFDYIIFTEVLEHLVVNPIDLLSSIISLLKPEGYLYITTPNFFQYGYLGMIAERENPQKIYPRRGENLDAHHHFREYSMKELLRFIQESGGQIENYYFSDCWDDVVLRETVLQKNPDQKSNLVIISRASRPEIGPSHSGAQ